MGGISCLAAAALLAVAASIEHGVISKEGRWVFIFADVFVIYASVSIYFFHHGQAGWTGFLGMALSILGFALIPIYDFAAMADVGGVPGGADLRRRFLSSPLIVGQLGIVLGFILTGISLLRSRSFPRWIGFVLILASLLFATVVPTGNQIFVSSGALLGAIGLVGAGVTIWRKSSGLAAKG